MRYVSCNQVSSEYYILEKNLLIHSCKSQDQSYLEVPGVINKRTLRVTYGGGRSSMVQFPYVVCYYYDVHGKFTKVYSLYA
jgi:hypothetical protein